MWKGFTQAQGWQHLSIQYSNNNTEVHIFQMINSSLSQQTSSKKYAFKIMSITPPTVIVSSNLIDKISLRSKDLNKVKTQIFALQKLRGYELVIQLHEIIIQDNENKDFFQSFLKKTRKNMKNICLIMDYFNGVTLKNYMINNKLSQAQIIKISLKIYQCLRILKQQSILHRDLRTVNIMIQNQQCLKLIDFDCAFIKDYSRLENLSFVCVPNLIAPEVVYLMNQSQDYKVNNEVDLYKMQQKCDLYGLGTIIFEMIVNKQYSGRDSLEHLRQSNISKQLIDLTILLLQQDYRLRVDFNQIQNIFLQLARQYGINYNIQPLIKIKNNVLILPFIDKQISNSSQSISNSHSDWSLQSSSTNNLSNSSKHVSRHLTINDYVINQSSANQ